MRRCTTAHRVHRDGAWREVRMTNDRMEQEQLSQLLCELAAHDRETLPSAQLQMAVMHRWNQRIATGGCVVAVSPRQSVRPVRWTPARVSFGVAGIAAMALLAVWVEIRPAGRPAPPASPPGPAIAEVRPGPIQGVPTVVEPARGATLVPQPPRSHRDDVAPSRAVAAPGAAEIEPFVRLLPMTEEELGTIRLARVRLRGQLAQTLGLGARMPLPGADGFVEADVLLGEDGLARAIRFVR